MLSQSLVTALEGPITPADKRGSEGQPADPAAGWLTGCGIPLEEKGFHPNGRADARSTDRAPLPLETGVEGIPVGKVRCGSVKRAGAAIGEGAAVVAQLHPFLAQRGSRSAEGRVKLDSTRA